MHTPLDRVQMVWAEAQQLTRYLHALPPAGSAGPPLFGAFTRILLHLYTNFTAPL